MLLSIVIPVYNLENYITQCLDSLIFGNAIDYEIIIVNDGSTDNSLAVIKNYASDLSLVTIIDQSNQGVSAARNRGLEQARGDFVWFFDGDDYLIADDDSIRLLSKSLSSNNADITFIKVIKSNSSLKHSKDINLDKGYDFDQDLSYLLCHDCLSSYSCDKIVKKSLLINNKVQFPIDITMSEDMYWSLQVFSESKSYALFYKIIYVYRQDRPDAATYRINQKKLQDMLWVLSQSMGLVSSAFHSTDSKKKGLQLYISRLWFNVAPELINQDSQLYLENKQQLLEYLSTFERYREDLILVNRGALLLEKLRKLMGIDLGLIVYSKIIAVRRSTMIKKLYKG